MNIVYSVTVFLALLFLIDGLQLQLPGVAGPESLAFDCNGEGPYAGVSDGRILKWQGPRLGWTEFATTTPHRRPRCLCDGSTDLRWEHVCGRPLGIKFNPVTCDLYIADAYFGLMKVGSDGGRAQQLASSADGICFRFTNALDIDPVSGSVYFTDSSMYYQRREYPLIIETGDASGRLLKYNPHNKEVTVMYTGLAFANGVALDKNQSYILVGESLTMKILRFWLDDGEGATQCPETFAQVSKFPDNIEMDSDGEYWVALNTRRGEQVTNLVAVKLDVNGKIVRRLYGDEQNALDSVSEIQERGGYVFAGSSVQSYVDIIRA